MIRTAVNFKIPLIFYGEDGEAEYGGSTELGNKALYDVEYIKRVYLEDGHEKVFEKIKFDKDSCIERYVMADKEIDMKCIKTFLIATFVDM